MRKLLHLPLVLLVAIVLVVGAVACGPPDARAPGGRWRCPAVVEAAERVGWPSSRLEWVDAIAWRESRCRADAWSPTRDAGAMQINYRWLAWGLCPVGIACSVPELFDLDVNLRAAAHVYAVQGPDAWSTN